MPEMANVREEEQDRRIFAVIGGDEASREKLLERWQKHLNSELTLPILVTGIEDFRWEEFYVLGPGSPEEYEALRREQPSYRDMFELTGIDAIADYEWCMFQEDLKAHVRRKSDGKRFVLGSCELKAVEAHTRAYQSAR